MTERLRARVDQIAKIFVARGETIAVAEGAAGGLISAALLSVPGASRFFVSGNVLYTAPGFVDFLGDRAERLRDLRGATEPFSLEIARIAREKLDTTWAIGESGAAGPTGNRYGDPPGHAAIGIAGPTEHTRTVETGIDERAENMWLFTEAALDLLREAIEPR